MKLSPLGQYGKPGIVGYTFECPGCNDIHVIYTEAVEGRPIWSFNWDMEKPTFSPSLLVRSGHHLPNYVTGKECWCTYAARYPDKEPPFKCVICHSYIRDGQIQFLGDCTHALAGQTVDLPDAT